MPMRPPTRPLRAVAFDLDGLMFNTEAVFFQCGTELLARRGLEFTLELSHRIMGRRGDEAFVELARILQLTDSPADLHEESNVILADLLVTQLQPMPGVFELLDLLEQRGLPKAVCTSSSRKHLLGILDRFELAPRFDFFLTAEDVTHGKPHPEIYQRAAEKHGVSTDEMLVLEDSETGSRAGAAAGAVVVSVPHDFSRAQNFEVANHIAGSLADEVLLQWLTHEN